MYTIRYTHHTYSASDLDTRCYNKMRYCLTRRFKVSKKILIALCFLWVTSCFVWYTTYFQKNGSIEIKYKNVSVSEHVLIVKENNNYGLADYGKAAILPPNMSENDDQLAKLYYKEYGFNKFLGDLISRHRKLPNIRPAKCNEIGRHRVDLPQTDIIISFHNEAWSLLIRTIHSVLDRTPYHLIKNIILVDDFSDKEHLRKPLEDYWSNEPKIVILRNHQWEGLIRTKLKGFLYGSAPIATFLDAHCECAEGWLEPLLDRIARNPTTVACPTIDFIDHRTFEYTYKSLTSSLVGGFTWDMNFRWEWEIAYNGVKRQDVAEPIKSPVMAGGLFSIDREYFTMLGMYDDSFKIWGGENLELSFKAWMCGGTIEIVPCSRVGHMAKAFHPYNYSAPVIKTNLGRVAMVWMDDFAQYYFELLNPDMNLNFGDVEDRIALRRGLNCKSFSWYLNNIYPTILRPDKLINVGEISVLNRSLCMQQAIFADFPSLGPCTGQGWNQKWSYTQRFEISRDYFKCLDSSEDKGLIMFSCQNWSSQKWSYISDTQQLVDVRKDCLTAVPANLTLTVSKCDNKKAEQRFIFK